jgi:hypothetical protein
MAGARARATAVGLGRRGVIPEATVLVVGNDDGHVLPLGARLELGDDIGDMGIARHLVN